MNSPRPLSGLLHKNANPTLDGLVKRCQHLQKLEQQLSACLDIRSIGHCRLINVHQGELLLGVDSAAWASRLRYQIPTLLDCVRKQDGLRGLRNIRLTVLPSQETSKPPLTRRPANLSRESALALQSCANHIEHDGLRQALERLASRALTIKQDLS